MRRLHGYEWGRTVSWRGGSPSAAVQSEGGQPERTRGCGLHALVRLTMETWRANKWKSSVIIGDKSATKHQFEGLRAAFHHLRQAVRRPCQSGRSVKIIIVQVIEHRELCETVSQSAGSVMMMGDAFNSGLNILLSPQSDGALEARQNSSHQRGKPPFAQMECASLGQL